MLYYQGIACGSSLRKIGYAYADRIEGPWHRCEHEILLTEDANNPAPCVRPDGSLLLAYRTKGLIVNVVKADAFDGEYTTIARDIFPDGRLEDPDLYYDGGVYHMIVEDNQGILTGSVRHGGHLVSEDGIRWQPHASPHAYTHQLEWADGTSQTATRRERPDVFNDETGTKGMGAPTHLLTGVLIDGHSWCVVQQIGSV